MDETRIGLTEAFNQHIPLSITSKTQLTTEEGAPASTIEQREVTVVFADIRGFTTLADCMPPEELAAVLNTYLSTVTIAFLKHDVMMNDMVAIALWRFGMPL